MKTRVQHHMTPPFRSPPSDARKPHVEANRKAEPPEVAVEESFLGTFAEHLGLGKPYFPRDVDVEQIDLAVLRDEVAFLVEHGGGVEKLSIALLDLRPADDESAVLLRQRGQQPATGGLRKDVRMCRRSWRNVFSILFEKRHPVGDVE